MANRWPARSGAIPDAFGISQKTFREIDKFIDELEVGSKQWVFAQNVAVELLAKSTQGQAEMLMRGPKTTPYFARQPGGSAGAWQIPVRRITSKTYQGWRVKMLTLGVWRTYNDTRGAYMVEFGISRGGGGRRRPILKKSILNTLTIIARTRFGQRIAQETWGNLRNNKGQFRTVAAQLRTTSLRLSGIVVVGPKGYLP